MKPTVLFVLLDRFADWEGAFLAAALRSGLMPGDEGRFDAVYAAPEGCPVVSIGGMRLLPDRDLGSLPDDCAAVVLVGGMSWQTPAAAAVVPLVEEALRRRIPVGAICNATAFLAMHGFLNGVRHTGNALAMLREWGGERYTGAALYEERQAVSDGGIVTANGSAQLEFARELLLLLGAGSPEQVAAWYGFYKKGFREE